MKKLFYCILVITNASVFSQNALEVSGNLSEMQVATNGASAGGGLGFWIPGAKTDNAIEGSVYLFSNWNDLFKIISKEGIVNKVFNLNYNIKTKTLESTISKDSVFQYDTQKFEYVISSNKKYRFINEGDLAGMFLEIHKSDKVEIYKEYRVSLSIGTINPLTQQKLSSDKYFFANKFHIKVNNNPFQKISLKKKPILKLLGDKAKLVEKFAFDSKLDFTSENDLSKILAYYDSL